MNVCRIHGDLAVGCSLSSDYRSLTFLCYLLLVSKKLYGFTSSSYTGRRNGRRFFGPIFSVSIVRDRVWSSFVWFLSSEEKSSLKAENRGSIAGSVLLLNGKVRFLLVEFCFCQQQCWKRFKLFSRNTSGF